MGTTGMHVVWERIERVLRRAAPDRLAALAGGASPEAIAATEKRLGLPLPAEVQQSYAVHDGSGITSVLPCEMYGPTAMVLLSLNEVVETREMWLGWRDGGSFDARAARPRGPIRSEWWNRTWVPVTWDGGGDHLCIDLDPAPGGVVGQVIYFSHEEGPREVVASGWRTYLETFAGDLESGRLRFERGELVAGG